MMSYTLKKKVLPSAMAVAMASGALLSGNVSAIHLSDEGTGQVLLAPMYWAGDPENVGRTNDTEFAITNTRTDTAVKVKVVFRSRVASSECLDFICYMTPGDVCRFNAGVLDNGKTGVYSTDDSVKAGVPSGSGEVDSLAAAEATFASKVKFEAEWAPVQLGAGDSCDMGHVEVIGAYGVQNSAIGYNAAGNQERIIIQPPMSKFQLAKIFDAPRTMGDTSTFPRRLHRPVTTGNDVAQNSADDLTLALANNATNGSTREQDVRNAITGSEPLSTLAVAAAPNIRSTDPTWVQLTGTATISNGSDRMSYQIPALDGAVGDMVASPFVTPDGLVIVGSDNVSELNTNMAMFDGLVISNPAYDDSVAFESSIGDRFGVRPFGGVFPGLGLPGSSKLVEIEAALATTLQSGEYSISGNNMTFLQTTFPTRYTHEGRDPCNVGFPAPATGNFTSPFAPNGVMPISVNIYDDFENTKVATGGVFVSPAPIVIPDVINLVETNYYIPNWISEFERGWFNVVFETTANTVAGDVRNCPYAGAPALGNVHKFITTSTGAPSQSLMVPMVHN